MPPRTMAPVSAAAAAVLAACTPGGAPSAPIPPVSTGRVHVRVFTEPSPVRMLASAGRYVFVATDGDLERWDASGKVTPLSTANGPSGPIVALAPDVDRRWVWILTETGLGHYDVSSEVFHPIATPPSASIDFAQLAKDGATIAPATDGGAWIGSAHGLLYVSAETGWQTTPIKHPIHQLVRDRAGWLWLATRDGLAARKPTGEILRIGAAEGCAIVEPRLLVELPGDRMMLVGGDDAGRDRIAFGKQLQWTTYRALPDARWDAAARRGNGAVLMTGDRLYRISPADPTRVRPLARDGMRLVALTGTRAPADGRLRPADGDLRPADGGLRPADEWVIDPVDVVVPPGALTLASVDDQLLIGTRDLGTARYRDGDQRPRDWLRRRQMFLDATTLSVACAKVDDCWLATGTRQAWHWTGDRFVPHGPDEVVLAVVRDAGGVVHALHRPVDGTTIQVSRIDAAGWTLLPKLAITTGGPAPTLSFAHVGANNQLWVGLRDRDGDELHAAGVAAIDLATSRVTYHRPTLEPVLPGRPRPLPIPTSIVDGDVHGEVGWFVTGDGVVRVANGKVDTWTELDGVTGDLAQAVSIAADGSVVVGTQNGAVRWDGRWELEPALGFAINDLVTTQSGQIWMATEHGIAAWDGHKVRRVDTRRGLAENRMVDVAVDQFDRVWARGPGSLTLISQ